MSVMIHTELFDRGTQALKTGQYDEARRLFQEGEARAGTAGQTQGFLQAAEAKLATGEVDSAATLFTQALERNPSLTEAYVGLARVALFTHEREAARVHANAAIRLAPRLGLAWTMLGLVQEASGDTEGALGYLRKGVELSPQAYLCQLNHGRLLAAAGRAQEAITPLVAATKLAPANPDGFAMLGLAYRQTKQYQLALRTLERAKELAPRSLDAWATLADVLFEVREFQAARDILDHGLKACGEHPALLEKAEAAAMMLGDAPGAIGYIERELAVVPEHEQGWLNLAGLALTNRDFDKAEQAAKTLLAKNPRQADAWFLLGNLYGAIPREAESEAAYRQAIACAPGNWKALMNLATLFLESKAPQKHAEAVALLERAGELAPRGEWRVTYNRALAMTRLGQREQALELARRIQAEAPSGDAMVAQARRLEVNLLEAPL